ncbi:hypothetical protein [Helicobacter sp. UBA3407]|nr:hypothetical protein [Helicobacter sp. UBA3407]
MNNFSLPLQNLLSRDSKMKSTASLRASLKTCVAIHNLNQK